MPQFTKAVGDPIGASTLIRASPPSVMLPVTVFSPSPRLRIAPPPPTPLPAMVKFSAVVMPPDNSSAAPLCTVVPPFVAPSEALLFATTLPAEMVVLPV